MSNISSIIFYNIVFVLILFFLRKGQRNHVIEYLGVIMLILLAVFRYDIGFDYENYYKDIYTLKNAFDLYGSSYVFNKMEIRMEPSFTFFVWLFKDFNNTFIYVFAIYSILTIGFIYKALKKQNAVFWGMFIIITLLILFRTFDQIRQCLAMSIFLYSLAYLDGEKRNLMRYCSFILLATLFHYTAIIMLLAILLTKFKPNIKLYIAVIILAYIIGLAGGWSKFIHFIFENSFMYISFLDSEKQMVQNTGGGYIYTAITIIYTVLMSISYKNSLYTNLLFVGTVLFVIASGNPNVNRIAFYFLIVNALSFPLFVSSTHRKTIMKMVILMLCVQFEVRMLITESSGCIPYDYVGSENFEMKKLRYRNRN